MTAPYRCDHSPRCKCADVAESSHRQLCDALNDRNDLRAERGLEQARAGAVRAALAVALDVLREIEAKTARLGGPCLVCGKHPDDKEHAPHCALAAALGAK
jgi:hypothetical protein